MYKFQFRKYICHYPQHLLHGGTSINTHSTRERAWENIIPVRAMAEAGNTPYVHTSGEEKYKNTQATSLTKSTLTKRGSNRKDWTLESFAVPKRVSRGFHVPSWKSHPIISEMQTEEPHASFWNINNWHSQAHEGMALSQWPRWLTRRALWLKESWQVYFYKVVVVVVVEVVI